MNVKQIHTIATTTPTARTSLAVSNVIVRKALKGTELIYANKNWRNVLTELTGVIKLQPRPKPRALTPLMFPDGNAFVMWDTDYIIHQDIQRSLMKMILNMDSLCLPFDVLT